MRILISGSSGFVGSNLLLFLKNSGYEVFRLVRKQSDVDTDCVFCNFLDNNYKISDFEGFDVVIHLAGENIVGRWTEKKRVRIRESRVKSTNILYEIFSALSSPPSTFICASATGYYGNRGDEVLTESSELGHGFLSEVSKQWESASKKSSELGIRVVQIRTGIVLGKNGGALQKMLTPFKLGLGGKIGNGNQYISWISINDQIEAIKFLIENDGLNGPYNLVSPSPVTNSAFTKTLGDILNRPTFFKVPEFMTRVLFGDMADEVFLSSTRVIPKNLINAGFKFKHEDLKETLLDLLNVQ